MNTAVEFTGEVVSIRKLDDFTIIKLDDNDYGIKLAQCGYVNVSRQGVLSSLFFGSSRKLEKGDKVVGQLEAFISGSIKFDAAQLPLPKPMTNPENAVKVPRMINIRLQMAN